MPRVLALLAVFAAIFIAAPGARAGGDLVPQAPAALPDFAFTDANGAVRTLSEYRGKPVILHFWATWCAPCVEELPSLARFQRERPEVTVLPLSQDFRPQIVREFYAAHALEGLPVLIDKQAAVFRKFDFRGLPSTVLIDSEGSAVAAASGAVDWQADAVAQAVEAAKAGRRE